MTVNPSASPLAPFLDRLASPVIPQLRQDMGQAPGTQRVTERFETLQKLRKEHHQHEVVRLHQELVSRGIQPLPEGVTIRALLKGLHDGDFLMKGANLVFFSPILGEVDLSLFNRGLPAFAGNRGQVQLLYGLAILTGRDDFTSSASVCQAARELAPSLLTQQGWGRISASWRNLAEILRVGFDTYQGPEGYQSFAMEWAAGDMKQAHAIASALLSKHDFQALQWGKAVQLRVTQVETFQAHLRDSLAAAEKIPTGHLNLEGYITFAQLPGIDGDMHKAFAIASALLSKDDFRKLRWGNQIPLQATQVKTFRDHLGEALTEAGRVPKGEGNLAGYLAFSRLPGIDGDMHKAHTIASALLPKQDFRRLRFGKKIPLRTSQVEIFQAHLKAALAKAGEIPAGQVNLAGYMAFARLPGIDGKMEIAHKIASALLSREDLRRLHWGKGIPLRVSQVETFQKHLREALTKAREVPEGSTNLSEYMSFAQLPGIDGSMQKAYKIASALLSTHDFRALRWGRLLPLKVSQLKTFQARLGEALAAAGSMPQGRTNLAGYMDFARLPGIDGSLIKAQVIATALLSKKDFQKLQWGHSIPLHVDQVAIFQAHLREALTKADRLPEGKSNLAGYMAFAQLPGVDGNMQKAHLIASALLSKDEMRRLRWGKQISLQVTQVEIFQDHLREALTEAKKLPIGRDNLAGCMSFAKLPGLDGNMWKAHRIASALLPRKDFARLQWGIELPLHVNQVQLFQGHLKEALANSTGLSEGETNLAGYRAFARLPGIDGNMSKAHTIASALLSREDFQRLQWGKGIPLQEAQVETFQARLGEALAVVGKMPKGQTNLAGYMAFARLPGIEGDMKKAYSVASSLLSKDDFSRLEWGKEIPLKVEQIPVFQGHLRTALSRAARITGERINLEGYMAFARLPGIDGNMSKAHKIASALLSGEDFQRLQWGKENMLHVSQVELATSYLLKGLQDGTIQGEEGWTRFADLISKPREHARFVASALLPREFYRRLGWVLSPKYLAQELVYERLHHAEEALDVNPHEALIHEMIVSAPGGRVQKSLAVTILKLALIEERLVPSVSPQAFRRRAFRLLRNATRTAVVTNQKESYRIPVSHFPNPEEAAMAKETEERVAAALTVLTESERQLLELTVLDDLSLEEAALEMGIGFDESSSQLERARVKMRKALDLPKFFALEVGA